MRVEQGRRMRERPPRPPRVVVAERDVRARRVRGPPRRPPRVVAADRDVGGRGRLARRVPRARAAVLTELEHRDLREARADPRRRPVARAVVGDHDRRPLGQRAQALERARKVVVALARRDRDAHARRVNPVLGARHPYRALPERPGSAAGGGQLARTRARGAALAHGTSAPSSSTTVAPSPSGARGTSPIPPSPKSGSRITDRCPGLAIHAATTASALATAPGARARSSPSSQHGAVRYPARRARFSTVPPDGETWAK